MTCMVWIKDFQSLIVGIIGFAGVILALVVNAWLGRRDVREQRRHISSTLRVQLVEELRINRSSLVENIKEWEGLSEDQKKTKGCFVPTKTMDDAYTSSLDKIGLLSEEEVSNVMYAYLSIRTHYNNLSLISVPVENALGHVNVPPGWVESLDGMSKSLIEHINKAIESLEQAQKRHAQSI